MKNMIRKAVAVLAAGMMLVQGAVLADTISFEGTVAASDTYEVYAAIGGSVLSVDAEIGQYVCAGDVLATLETTTPIMKLRINLFASAKRFISAVIPMAFIPELV